MIQSFTLVWSRFGRAYERAISSLRSTRSDHRSVREEQRRLFGGKRSATQSQLPGKTKRKKTVSWTAKFVCLSSTHDYRVPTTCAARELLANAGLGEKKITIPDIECGIADFHSLLLESFPKLKDGGGFEFLRCTPNTRDLELIPPHISRVPRLLKQRVGNGRVYIRPIQRDLCLEAEEVSPQQEYEKVSE